jgi:hypothetical protein
VDDSARSENAWRRRSGSDRRRGSALINWRHLGFQGRRKSHRRADDRNNAYVDWYEPHLLFVVLAILSFSLADALITLKLLSLGAVELNPFLVGLIEQDTGLFVGLKIAMTSFAVIFLVIHKNFLLFNLLRVQHLLWAFLAGYALLIVYEIVLLVHLQGA